MNELYKSPDCLLTNKTIISMKKLILALFMAVALTACGTAYNTQLKQVELGMTLIRLSH